MEKKTAKKNENKIENQINKKSEKSFENQTIKNLEKNKKSKGKYVKEHIFQHKKRYIFSIVILLCSLFLLFILLKFYFVSGFDLSIKANPYQKSLYLYHNEAENVIFTLAKPNNFICTTECEYNIFDSEKNQIIMNGSAKTRNGFSFNYSFYAPSKGQGQKIYNVDFKCRNIYSLICLTNEKPVYATSLIILNYQLSPEEKNSSEIAQQQLEQDINLFSELDIENQKNNIIFNYLNGKLNFNDVNDINGINIYSNQEYNFQEYFKINNSLMQFLELWGDEEYFAINEQISLFHQNLLNQFDQEKSFETQIDEVVMQHNIFAEKLFNENQNILDISKIALLNLNNDLLREEFLIAYSNINILNSFFNSLNFTNYSGINEELRNLNPQIEFSQLISLDEQYSSITSGSEKIKTEYAVICAIKSYCLDENELPEYLFYPEFNQIKNNSKNSEKICGDISKLKKIQKNADADFAYAYFTLHYPIETTYENQAITRNNVIAFLYNNLTLQNYLNNPDFANIIDAIKSDEYAKIKNKEIEMQNALSYEYNKKITEFNTGDSVYNPNINFSNLNIISNLNSILNPNISSTSNLASNQDYCYKLIDYFNSLNNSQSTDNFYRREFILNYVFEYCSGINKTTISKTYLLSEFEIQENLMNDSYDRIIKSEEMSSLSDDFIKLAIISNNTQATYSYFENKCLLNYLDNMQENYSNVVQSITSLTNLNISAVFIPESLTTNISSRFNLSLKEHKPMCCVFGECKVCCNETSCPEDSSSYPIIFVHGHAANKAQSPHYSLNVFDELQNILQNEGYLNAGIMLPDDSYSEVSKGEWGKSGFPIEVKFTYYLDVYDNNGTIIDVLKNSEYIENYSVRLNRAVELLKYRTGKSKVNILAHSMGGLVAREYIREFGDDSVNKLVMFGTPNYGIMGQTERLCPVLGETKECVEIKEGSDFLKRLNSHDFENNNYDKNKTATKYYIIIGTGCDTSGFDGDGIVPAKNVNLSYSKNYYIEGICDDWFDPLHGQMLEQIDGRYNQTYKYIQEILKE